MVTDPKPTEIKYPEVRVDLGNLHGPDGNAYAILGAVTRALRNAKLQHEIAAYTKEAT